MKYPTRIYYTETDKGLMWDRWQKGESAYKANKGPIPSHPPGIETLETVIKSV